MSWTDERVETLKKMWGEGQSASQIAKELGGVTRNAVIGKVHRLGLSNRTAGAPAADAAAKPEPKAKPTAPKVEAKPKLKSPPQPRRQGPTCPRANRSSLRASPFRRSRRPMKSAPRRWPKLAKSRRRPRRSA